MLKTLLDRQNHDIMTRRPITLAFDRTIREAVEVMRAKNIGAVIITRQGLLCGIFTERDVLKRADGLTNAQWNQPVSEYMTADPECLRADDSVVWDLAPADSLFP